MVGVRERARVGVGEAKSPPRRQPPIESAYQHFRLERQGALLAETTLLYYDGMVRPFLRWLEEFEIAIGTRPTTDDEHIDQ